MVKVIYKISLFITLGLVLISCSSNPERKTSKNIIPVQSRITVAGVSNETDNKNMQNLRIGFGAKSILAQLVYDSGKFILIEDNAEIHRAIENSYKGDMTNINKNLDKLTEGMKADFTCYGSIYYIGSPQQKSSIAGFKSVKSSTVIKVELTIVNNKTKKKTTAIGIGKSTTAAKAVLLEFNEEKTDIENTRLGIAMKEALEDAFNKLLENVR